MKYTIVHTSSSGSVSLEVLEKDELEERLNQEYYGKSPILAGQVRYRHDLRGTAGTFIIPGAPIEPVPVEKVKRWAMP